MRESGILMPVSSLPGPYGIGCFGAEALKFVDFLAAAGQHIWQLLPLSPTGYGDSPYQSCSAFAGNPYFVDLEALEKEGLLTAADLKAESWGKNPLEVDYGTLYVSRFAVLRKAYAAWRSQCAGLHGCTYYYPDDYYAFTLANEDWLDDYALYMALKVANKMKNWVEWDAPYRRRDKAALAAFAAANEEEIGFWKFVQYKFSVQWQAVKAYANEKGVQILGDIPIYVSADSVDAWVGGKLFELDADGRFARVAGCPPDYFSADGQLWGNPLFRWERMKEDGYAWWLDRVAFQFEIYDVLRLDHFRGFESYYAIPYGEETARNGRWLPGPGMDFFKTLRRSLGPRRIIAEDLGYLTPEVKAMLSASGYPGMKIMQFAFDSREPGNYLPYTYPRNSVVYTGTHDNVTAEGWRQSASAEDVAYACRYLRCAPEDLTEAMICACLSCVSDMAVIPLADWLHLDAEARINTPSTQGANWQWRLTQPLTPALSAHIAALTALYHRVPGEEL